MESFCAVSFRKATAFYGFTGEKKERQHLQNLYRVARHPNVNLLKAFLELILEPDEKFAILGRVMNIYENAKMLVAIHISLKLPLPVVKGSEMINGVLGRIAMKKKGVDSWYWLVKQILREGGRDD